MLGGDAVARTPGPGRCSCRPGTRRSACPGRGTSSGRCGCSRCWRSRPTCSSTRTCSTGSPVIEAKVAEIAGGARAEIDRVLATGRRGGGGRVRLPEVRAGRLAGRAAAADGDRRGRRRRRQPVHRDRAEPADRRPRRPRSSTVDPGVEQPAVDGGAGLARRPGRRRGRAALAELRARRAAPTPNLMPATLRCARAGVTTGEWAGALREVFGEYRAPTGVSRRRGRRRADAAWPRCASGCAQPVRELGGRLRFLVGKPGLDGHSNGAEQIAVRARDAGFEVVYSGIRLTPAQIVAVGGRGGRRRWSGCRCCPARTCRWCRRCWTGCGRPGLDDVPLVVGGIIPDADADPAARARGGPGVHAQGLRDDHGARSRWWTPSGRRTGSTEPVLV